MIVFLYPINVKTAEPIGPTFLWDLAWPQGKFLDDRIFKNLPQTKFYFWKFWKSTIFFNRRIFLMMFSKRNCLQMKLKMGAKRPMPSKTKFNKRLKSSQFCWKYWIIIITRLLLFVNASRPFLTWNVFWQHFKTWGHIIP